MVCVVQEAKNIRMVEQGKVEVFLAHLTSSSMTEDRCTEKRVQENLSVLENYTSLQSLVAQGFLNQRRVW